MCEKDCGFKPLLPWPGRGLPDSARRLVAPMISLCEQTRTVKAALDIWCYMQDEDESLCGAQKEFLCLGGNLWLIKPEVAEANHTEPFAFSVTSSIQDHQDPISFSAIKQGLRFDAFSKNSHIVNSPY
jgi:hypothetical protein